jgi:uncharacterized protein (DUF4415 family)
MNAKSSKKKSGKTGTDWGFLRSPSDEGIDFSDIPPLGPDFWKNAKVWRPRGNKDSVTLRIDHDVLEWFKKPGKGYQTRINAVLRTYVEHAAHAT